MDEPRIISSTLIVRHAVSLVNPLCVPKFSNHRNFPCSLAIFAFNCAIFANILVLSVQSM